MADLISLYALEPELDAHRDVLKRLCDAAGIPIVREYNVRYIDRADVVKLDNELYHWRRRRKLWANPPSARAASKP